MFVLLYALLCVPAAQAQDMAPYIQPLEKTADPLCFSIRNGTSYTVFGSIVTEYYMTDKGIPGRDRNNFRLDAGEIKEHCSNGPFYGENGDELELVLRTVIPIFSCRFPAYGEILIYSEKNKDGSTKTLAACQ